MVRKLSRSSVLARVLPGMENDDQRANDQSDHGGERCGSTDEKGEAGSPSQKEKHDKPLLDFVSPAGALTQPVSPGPEGLAQQFAFKLGSGVFSRDLSRNA